MSVEDVARGHYRRQAQLADGAAAAARALWAELDPADPAGSWTSERLADRLLVAVGTFQVAAASEVPPYTAAALTEQGADSDPAGDLEPRALAGVASDGRALDTLLTQSLVATTRAAAAGAAPDRALQLGESTLTMLAATQVADAGRAAEHVAMTVEPAVTGYVRMLVPPACGRCAVLAGRTYRRATAFARHPHCDCRMVPAAEDIPLDLTTDPRRYFHSLSQADQTRYFTTAGAAAIRAGADIGQVVNARRGASGLDAPGLLSPGQVDALGRGRLRRVDAYGRPVYITTEGTTARGVAGQRIRAWSASTTTTSGELPPRLMPESILELADGDREAAITMLDRFGYVIARRTAPIPQPRPAEQPADRPAQRERVEVAAPAPDPTPPPADRQVDQHLPAAELAAAGDGHPDPRDLSEDDLYDAMQEALAADDLDWFALLGEESDRREAEAERREARNERDRARAEAKRAAREEEQGALFERLLDEGVDEEEAVHRAYGIPVERQRRERALARLQASGYEGTFAQASRSAYRDRLRELLIEAENATNGYLLSREGERRRLDPRKLFTGTDAFARKWASDELREHWDQTGGRMTYDRYVAEELLGDTPASGREDYLR